MLLVWLAAAPLPAQTIRGRLVERETLSPIPGALIELLDHEGVRLAGTVSGERGFYFVRAPGAGLYRLRVGRIGFENKLSPPVVLQADESVTYRLEASRIPIQLPALKVEGESECRVRPEEGKVTYVLWSEARKALTVAAWTERNELYSYRGILYRQVVDAFGQPVRAPEEAPVWIQGEHPFYSVPALELEREGYRRREKPGVAYYAPDATVLLSDAFLNTHCFGATKGKGGTDGLVGLSFEPAVDRSIVDVKGVLWLDEESAELRFLEFTYTRLPREEAKLGLKGRVDFERLDTGFWIISAWWIRTPILRRGTDYLHQNGGYVTEIEIRRKRFEPVERVEPHPDVAGPGFAADRAALQPIPENIEPENGPSP